MLTAIQEGRSTLATPGAVGATCPGCGVRVIAKCGEIVTWHWAHDSGSTCAYAHESEWHLGWKKWAYDHGCDVEKVIGSHRADIVTPEGRVIELQSAGLEPAQIRDREDTYEDMIWIARVTEEQEERVRIGKDLNGGGKGFWYKRGPKWLASTSKPLHLHLPSLRDLWRVRVNLVDKETQWGTSQRMLGRAWPARREDVLQIRERILFCEEHSSHFCPCVCPSIYDERTAAMWA